MELAKALALLMALIAMAGRALVHIRLQLWRMLEASIEERQSRSSFLNEYFVPKIRQAQKAGGWCAMIFRPAWHADFRRCDVVLSS